MTQEQIEVTLRQVVEAVNQQNDAIKALEGARVSVIEKIEAERVAAIDRSTRSDEERDAKHLVLEEKRLANEQKHLDLLAALNRSQEATAVATLAAAMTTRYGIMLEDADTGRCMTFEETAVHYVRIARKALGIST